MKTLRCWNGRGHTARGDSFYVAAYSVADAARLLARATFILRKITFLMDDWWFKKECSSYQREIRDYFSECWGDPMDGITPVRGVWYSSDDREQPKLVLSGNATESADGSGKPK